MDTATKLLFKGPIFGQITLALLSKNNHNVSGTLRKVSLLCLQLFFFFFRKCGLKCTLPSVMSQRVPHYYFYHISDIIPSQLLAYLVFVSIQTKLQF